MEHPRDTQASLHYSGPYANPFLPDLLPDQPGASSPVASTNGESAVHDQFMMMMDEDEDDL